MTKEKTQQEKQSLPSYLTGDVITRSFLGLKMSEFQTSSAFVHEPDLCDTQVASGRGLE